MNNVKSEKVIHSRLLSVKETAAYLGISTRTIYNKTGPKAKKKFPVKAKRVGGLIKFDRAELDRYLDSI